MNPDLEATANATWEFVKQIDGKDYVYYEGDIDSVMQPLVANSIIVASLAVYSFALVLGLLGNGACIFIMLADEKNRSIRHFLVSLALADIIFLSMSVPMKYIIVFFYKWRLGAVVCKLEPCIELLACAASVFNIVGVTIERFVVIAMPFKARKCCSAGVTKKAALFVWALAVVCCVPGALVKRADEFGLWNDNGHATVTICTYYDALQYAYMWYRLVLLFVAPMTVVSGCYIAVVHVLRRSNKQRRLMTALTAGSIRSRPNEKKEQEHLLEFGHATQTKLQEKSHVVYEGRNQVTKMLAVIVLNFSVCWGPRLVVNIANAEATQSEVSAEYGYNMMNFKFIANMLPYIHSCLNPIIYCAMSTNFRESSRNAAVKYCSRLVSKRTLDEWCSSIPPSTTSNTRSVSCTTSNRGSSLQPC